MSYGDNLFVSLDYSDDHLPANGELVPSDLRNFIKRLRERLRPTRDCHACFYSWLDNTCTYHIPQVRYFAIGEYGGYEGNPHVKKFPAPKRAWNPHYHMFLFGLNEHTHKKVIEESWHNGRDRGKMPLGRVHIGRLEPRSVGYVTDYAVKGWTYPKCDRLKGRFPEFMRCSLKPGIGEPTIKRMAKSVEKRPVLQSKLIKQLRHGKEKMPLGRYLLDKWKEYAGMENAQYDVDFWAFQEDFFNKYLRKDGYIENYKAKNKGRFDAISKKNKVFKKKGPL